MHCLDAKWWKYRNNGRNKFVKLRLSTDLTRFLDNKKSALGKRNLTDFEQAIKWTPQYMCKQMYTCKSGRLSHESRHTRVWHLYKYTSVACRRSPVHLD